ncbi:MAG: hypothetical protein IJ628_02595 [Bacteroidaceae bacterium]|nr:hypothetical protein [Bacteroidaceae bacterium]
MEEHRTHKNKRIIYYSLSVIILLLSFLIAIWIGKDEIMSIALLTIGATGGFVFLRLGYKCENTDKKVLSIPVLAVISVIFFIVLFYLTSYLDVWGGPIIIRIIGCLGLTLISAGTIYRSNRKKTDD